MNAETQPPQPPLKNVPDNRLGRSAALVLAIGVAATGATGVALAVMQDSEESYTIAGVGLSAMGVLGLWAAVLAVRALRKGERARLPAAVLSLLLLALAAASIPHWEIVWPSSDSFVYRWCLPVFVPFAAASTALAGPLAWWRVRRAEKRALAGGHSTEAWSRRRRWTRGLAWYAAAMVLLALTMLPWPLFVYCASGSNYYRDREMKNFRWRVANAMPNFIRDGSETLLSLPGWKFADDSRGRLVERGLLSTDRLVAHLCGSDPSLKLAACYGIRRHPADALEFAEKAATGGVAAMTPTMLYYFGGLVGEKGDAQQVFRLWEDPRTSAVFRNEMLRTVGICKRFAILESMSESARDADLAVILLTLAEYGGHPVQRRIWLKFLADPDPARRLAAAKCLRYIRDYDVHMAYLKDPDLEVRRITLMMFFDTSDLYVRRQWYQRLVEFMDDKDLPLRRCAVYMIASLLELPVEATPMPNQGTGSQTVLEGGTPLPEQPGEAQELESVRAAAREFQRELDRVKALPVPQ